MEKKTTFESINFEKDLHVVIDVTCRDADYANHQYDYWLFDGDREVKPAELTEAEQEYLETQLDELAREAAPEAHQDYQAGKADRDYDAWRDRDIT